MMVLGVPAATALAWLLAVAFAGAGVFNLLAGAEVKAGFVRWGYPSWWNLVTGGLEAVAALLMAIPSARRAGLILGAAICLAAIATVLRFREYRHLPPPAALLALSLLDFALSAA